MQPENSALLLNIKIPKDDHKVYAHKFHLFHKLSVVFARDFSLTGFFIVSSVMLYFIKNYFKTHILQLKQLLTL